MKKTFRGGVHPYDGKVLTQDKVIVTLHPTGEAVYPLNQHIGAPAVPAVKKGDVVSVGQCIATAGDGISACICSGVSGTVKAIEKRCAISGDFMQSIVIDNDGKYTPVSTLGQTRDFRNMSNAQIRDIAQAAGLIGLGGAGFPATVKMTPADDAAITHILINGAECEPYLTSDYRLMMEKTDDLFGGVDILLQMFPHAEGIIAIEDNKPEAIRALTAMAAKFPRVRVCALKTKYPQGGERSLIYAVTGKKVHSKILPYQVGCIVHNVATVIALYQAVCHSTPLIRRVVTLSGDALAGIGNYDVPIGISLAEVVEMTGGFSKPAEKMICGGPMMGTGLFTLDVPVQKTTSSLLAFAEDTDARKAKTACIHCGRCVKVCPANLIPQMMGKAVKRGDIDAFQSLGGMECVSCGSCSYICPANIRLTQSFVYAKTEVRKHQKKEEMKNG